jgi:hypothetical protein
MVATLAQVQERQIQQDTMKAQYQHLRSQLAGSDRAPRLLLYNINSRLNKTS